MIGRADQCSDTGFLDAQTCQIFLLFGWRKIHQITLDLSTDDNGFGIMMSLDVITHGKDVFDCRWGHRPCNDLTEAIYNRQALSQIILGNIAGKKCGFFREQEKGFKKGFFLAGKLQCDGRFAGIQMSFQPAKQGAFSKNGLVIGFDTFRLFFETLLHSGQVRQHKFGGDHLDIPQRINGTTDMMNVGILKASDDLNNRINFPDMGKKLVAETFTLAGALDQACDIHKFESGRNNLLRPGKFCQHIQSRVRHRYHAHIGFDGAEWIIGSFCFS